MKILYAVLIAAIVVMLTLEAWSGDYWRTVGFLLVLVCAVAVRDDLTETP